jgi:predicted MPP superfamily phosphohydrolase
MQTYLRSARAFGLVMLLSLLAANAIAWTQQTKPPASPEQKEFDANVKTYLDIHKKAFSKVPSIPKEVTDPALVMKHQTQLADAIRMARPNAKRGEIFTPAASSMITTALNQTLAGTNGAAARTAILGEGNPKTEATPVNLTVNATYPTTASRSTVPPSVLMVLPTLPKELEFRFVGRHLVLLDTQANIVVDFLLNAVSPAPAPAPANRTVQPTQSRTAVPAPAASTSTAKVTLKFAILGDTGTGTMPQFEIARKLEVTRTTFPFEFVIMLGDNMYGGENPNDFIKKFEKPYEPLLKAGVKFYAALGNHDEPDRQSAYKGFNMDGKRYYTFKPKDGVRFFALDSNYMDPKQLEWLEGELKASGSEWKIAFFHHPLYSSGTKHGSDLELRKALEPMLIKYGVDVVFAGHEHFYERIKPQQNIQHFILGSSAKLRKNGIAKNSPLTAKGFDTDYAYMVAEIVDDAMTFQTIARDGKVVDSGTFRRVERKLATTTAVTK